MTDHVAIMSKKPPFLKWILDGSKKVESRWYKTKRTPYGRIKENDIIYFKNSGERITVKATVEKVLFFADLTQEKIKKIIKDYGDDIKLQNKDATTYTAKYCILLFLKDVQEITPFKIDKTGFGSGAAWLTMQNINTIKEKTPSTSHVNEQQQLAPS